MSETTDLLVVGASGTVGTAIVDGLADRRDYSVTCMDVVEHPDHDTVVVDVRDDEAIRSHFEGQDAVVHAALNIDLHSAVTDVAWSPALLDNLWATCNVMGAAVSADVETIVYTSSNHVVGMYEADHAPELYDLDYGLTLDHTTPPRPDSMYAVAKLYDEALGRFCAEWHDRAVYAIRVGTVRSPAADNPYGPAEVAAELGHLERGSEEYERGVARMKATWFSRRDVAHMVDRCVRTAGSGFEILYGVSGNDRRWFDIDRAREVVGYEPRDNGEEWDAPPA